jgi:hypothetical protein
MIISFVPNFMFDNLVTLLKRFRNYIVNKAFLVLMKLQNFKRWNVTFKRMYPGHVALQDAKGIQLHSNTASSVFHLGVNTDIVQGNWILSTTVFFLSLTEKIVRGWPSFFSLIMIATMSSCVQKCILRFDQCLSCGLISSYPTLGALYLLILPQAHKWMSLS